MWRGNVRTGSAFGVRDGDDAAASYLRSDELAAGIPSSEWPPLWTGIARMNGALPPAAPAPDPWALLRRGEDDRLVRAPGARDSDAHPRFDAPVPAGGYSWWYVDALSDDGQHGLTVIAFIGSVFSPYFKRSGRGNPLDHCALNVALYGPKARWTMTERGEHAVQPERDQFAIGPSSVRWAGDCLVIDIEERDKRIMNPLRRRVAGQIKVWPEMLNTEAFALDPAGKHLWHCLAPRARISVEMQAPELSWQGSAYLDSNRGSESLEEGFRIWHWSRAHLGKDVAVFYEGQRRDGTTFASALRFDKAGVPHEADLPPTAPLPNTLWQMERVTRADRGHATVRRTWEDSPFYTRSTLHARLYGEPVVAMQETLSLDRFCSPIVQQLIPHRMPRARK